MPSDLESAIRFLEETNDPATAFFSYTVDNTGEFGLIKANKEGLRLYAAEILKKSRQMEVAEQQPEPEQPLHFDPLQWICSETGYDLISGVLPQYQSRREILTSQLPPRRVTGPRRRKQPVLLFILMCITGALIMLATLKAFPNLRLWVNIH
ncbi:hypothetical protein [Puia sp.]|jgi:hypothetical protein|uniref:hypothetical protein n=1 Tax=Puia sp. TaxID=2045100 RepID=UPI002F40F0C2